VYDDTVRVLSPVTAAPSPDLSAFRARGGKLIQYHGWNDSVVPPDGSIGYFHALTQFEHLRGKSDAAFAQRIAKLDTKELAQRSRQYGDQVRQFHRLFMLPGVAHCALAGSTAPNRFGGGTLEPPKALRQPETHVVSSLMRWVEQGVAPQSIVISAVDAAGNVTRQRPVWPFPQQAVYGGTGSLDSAASFSCRFVDRDGNTPKGADEERAALLVEPGDPVHARRALEQRKLLLPNR
jgi:feruloyl esterase